MTAGGTATREGPVADVLGDRLAEQRDQLRAADRALRHGAPEALHDLRVAMRRIRTALATFGPYVDRSRTDPLRAELRWASVELGRARDAEVVAEQIATLLHHEPERLVVGPVRERVRRAADVARAEGDRTVTAVMASARYAALLTMLDDVVDAPPITGRSAKRADRQSTKRVLADRNRLLERAAHALDERDADARAVALHEVRKAAKRLRYAAEASRSVTGGQVVRLLRGATRLQGILGDHHDTVTTRAALEVLAEQAAEAGESAFTYGRLHAAAEGRAADLERVASTVLDDLRDA